MKKGYAYAITTGKVDCVSDKFGSNTYPETIAEIEFDEQPFLDWERLGGSLYFRDGEIVHIPAE